MADDEKGEKRTRAKTLNLLKKGGIKRKDDEIGNAAPNADKAAEHQPGGDAGGDQTKRAPASNSLLSALIKEANTLGRTHLKEVEDKRLSMIPNPDLSPQKIREEGAKEVEPQPIQRRGSGIARGGLQSSLPRPGDRNIPPGPGRGAPPPPPRRKPSTPNQNETRRDSTSGPVSSTSVAASASMPSLPLATSPVPSPRGTPPLEPHEEHDKSADRKSDEPMSPEKIKRLRKQAVNELITTESDYVRDLSIIHTLYYSPLKKFSGDMLQPQEFQCIFSNLSTITKLNEEIEGELKQLKDVDDALVGPVFLKLADYLKMYTQYCANQEACISTLDKLEKRSKPFAKFLDECAASPQARGLSINSFLIKPIQRICKYPLLLRELLKYTPEAHPDFTDLKAAYEKVSEVVEVVNKKKRDAENLQKILEIQGMISGASELKLIEPGRQFIMEGTFHKISKGHNQERHFFMFSDLLVYVSHNMLSNITGNLNISRKGTVININKTPFSKAGRKKYLLKGAIDLRAALIRDVQDDATYKNAFEIVRLEGKKRVITVCCSTLEEKRTWMAAIGEKIEDFLQKGMAMHQREGGGSGIFSAGGDALADRESSSSSTPMSPTKRPPTETPPPPPDSAVFIDALLSNNATDLTPELVKALGVGMEARMAAKGRPKKIGGRTRTRLPTQVLDAPPPTDPEELQRLLDEHERLMREEEEEEEEEEGEGEEEGGAEENEQQNGENQTNGGGGARNDGENDHANGPNGHKAANGVDPRRSSATLASGGGRGAGGGSGGMSRFTFGAMSQDKMQAALQQESSRENGTQAATQQPQPQQPRPHSTAGRTGPPPAMLAKSYSESNIGARAFNAGGGRGVGGAAGRMPPPSIPSKDSKPRTGGRGRGAWGGTPGAGSMLIEQQAKSMASLSSSMPSSSPPPNSGAESSNNPPSSPPAGEGAATGESPSSLENGGVADPDHPNGGGGGNESAAGEDAASVDSVTFKSRNFKSRISYCSPTPLDDPSINTSSARTKPLRTRPGS